MDETRSYMLWLVWADTRDDNAWNIGQPHPSMPWCCTISEDTARELFAGAHMLWEDVRKIVHEGRIAEIKLTAVDWRVVGDTAVHRRPGGR